MRKIILIVHTSIDGYVAGENGEFDLFDQSPENLDFVCSLTDDADAALVGKNSYQMLEAFWPSARDNANASKSEIKYSNWYNDADKIVISKSLSAEGLNNTRVISENIADEIHKLKNKTGKNILMFVSPTAFKTLNSLDLIDEYRIISYPALFGKGLPFFTLGDTYKKFELVETKQLSKGEVLMHYKRVG